MKSIIERAKKLLNIHPDQLTENLDPIRLKRTLDYLYDGEMETWAPLTYINGNFIRAHRIFLWLVRNKIKGKELVDFFKNESSDGGGYLCGVAYIISRMDGAKYSIDYVKRRELK